MSAQPNQPLNPSLQAVEERDPDEFEALLDEAEIALLTLAASRRILGLSIQRRRWDLPEVVVSWSGTLDNIDHVGRNVRVLFEAASGNFHVIHVRIDGNVWFDMEWDSGETARTWWNRSESFEGRNDDYRGPGSPPYSDILRIGFDAIRNPSEEDMATARVDSFPT